MNITLRPDQQKWLEDEVAAGRLTSVDDAVRRLVDRFLMPADADDSWVKPYLDEARASLARGEGIPAERVFAETDEWLKKRGA
jgi:Arc/MetJ-type ribon-helix-helix transcriptional regulator